MFAKKVDRDCGNLAIAWCWFNHNYSRIFCFLARYPENWHHWNRAEDSWAAEKDWQHNIRGIHQFGCLDGEGKLISVFPSLPLSLSPSLPLSLFPSLPLSCNETRCIVDGALADITSASLCWELCLPKLIIVCNVAFYIPPRMRYTKPLVGTTRHQQSYLV